MTDTNPFVPPTGLPAATPVAAPPTPGAPVAPPPPAETYGFSPVPEYAPATPTPTPQWVKGLILAAVVVGLVAAMGVVALLVQTLRTVASYDPSAPAGIGSENQSPAETPDYPPTEPLLEGDPGQPIAAEPLVCADCFDLDDAESLLLPESSYAALGVPESDEQTGSTKVYSEQLHAIRWWREDGGSPEHCYLTYSIAPLPVVAEPVPTDVRLQDLYFPEWHDDGTGTHVLSEAIRVFDSSAGAVTHLAEVATARDGCSGYTMAGLNYSAIVSPTPALELPPSVAATGWAEESGTWRKYAVDVQRGNLVVRLVLTTSGPGPSETAFRAFVQSYADALAGLQPMNPGSG